MKKSSIANAFSRAVSTYDAAATVQFTAANDLVRKTPNIEYNNAIDLGCGTGRVSKHLLQERNIQSLSLLDTSEAMLRHAQQINNIVDENCLLSNIEHFQAEEKYDLIFSNFALQWVNDLDKLLPQLCQQLTPNGKLALAFPIPPSLNQLSLCAKKLGIDLSLNPLPNIDSLKHALMKLQGRHDIYIEEKHYEEHCESLFDGLKKIKNMGATHQTQKTPLLSTHQIKLSKSSQATSLNWTVLFLYT